MPDLVFLKLGGSLITDKARAHTARPAVIQRLAREIREALDWSPHLRLVVGHGSGSFGHAAAKAQGFEQSKPRTGRGFAAVARAAASLNRLVVDALYDANIPVVVLAPSASGQAHDGTLRTLSIDPFWHALKQGLIPVTYGDVIWDDVTGWSIASTETIFSFLARALRPERIILAGEVSGVLWPAEGGEPGQPIPEISPGVWPTVRPGIHGANGLDVTGGMASKVADMVGLVNGLPGLTVEIISGLEPGRVEEALVGRRRVPGTRIVAVSS